LAEFGDESWELDALDPRTLAGLITDAVEAIRDEDAWQQAVAEEQRQRSLLRSASDRWGDVATFLANGNGQQ